METPRTANTDVRRQLHQTNTYAGHSMMAICTHSRSSNNRLTTGRGVNLSPTNVRWTFLVGSPDRTLLPFLHLGISQSGRAFRAFTQLTYRAQFPPEKRPLLSRITAVSAKTRSGRPCFAVVCQAVWEVDAAGSPPMDRSTGQPLLAET